MGNSKKKDSGTCFKVNISQQPGSEQLLALIEKIESGAVKYSQNNSIAYVSLPKPNQQKLSKHIKLTIERTPETGAEKNNHPLSMVIVK